MKMDLKYAARCGSGRVEFEFTIYPSFEGNSFVDLRCLLNENNLLINRS